MPYWDFMKGASEMLFGKDEPRKPDAVIKLPKPKEATPETEREVKRKYPKQHTQEWSTPPQKGQDPLPPERKEWNDSTAWDFMKGAGEQLARGLVEGAVGTAELGTLAPTPGNLPNLIRRVASGENPLTFPTTRAVNRDVVDPVLGPDEESLDPLQKKTDRFARLLGNFAIPAGPLAGGRVSRHLIETILGASSGMAGGEIAADLGGEDARIFGELLGGFGGMGAGAAALPAKAPRYAAATRVAAELFPDATITSGYRGPDHPLSKANPDSYHATTDKAVDMAPVPGMTFEQAKQRFKDAGYRILEAKNEVGKGRSRHATGDHWHFVIEPQAEHIAPDGAPGNRSVRPIAPEEIARIMDDPEAVDNVAPFPEERQVGSQLTPDEAVEHAEMRLPTADVVSLKIFRDNPGGEWELRKKQKADAEGHTYQGSVTAQTAKPIDIPVAFIRSNFKGALGENPVPGSTKYDTLQKSVEEKGFTDESPILIRINHRGEGYILEGNNRVAVAAANGVPTVKAEVQWVNGGENSKLSPAAVKEAISSGGRGGGGGDEPPFGGDDGGGRPPMSDAELLAKLKTSLGRSKTLYKEQEELRAIERQRRAAKLGHVQDTTSGLAGYYASKGALKGEMPRVDFESISQDFSPEELDRLFDMVKEHPALTKFDKVNAQAGLENLVNGKVPTPSELLLLNKALPPEIMDEILKKRSTYSSTEDLVANVTGLARSAASSGDLSFGFRQALFTFARNWNRNFFWKAFIDQFRQMPSEQAFQKGLHDIYNDPLYPMMKDAGVYLDTRGRLLTERDDYFQSYWAEQMPGEKISGLGYLVKTYNMTVGQAIKFSNRAFAAMGNAVRFMYFKQIVDQLTAGGISVAGDPKLLKDIGRWVNTSTGRGHLGRLEQAAPLLNIALYSSRLFKSRFDLLNPFFYVRLAPPVRKEALKSLAAYTGLMATLMGGARMAGLEVELDPRSSDFGKIKVGNTRYDITGGLAPFIRLYTRVGMSLADLPAKKFSDGTIKKLEGGFGQNTAFDEVVTFFRTKAAPWPGYLMNALDKQNVVGEPFDWDKDLAKLHMPMFADDVAELINEWGVERAIPMAIPGFFGINTMTYKPRKKKKPGRKKKAQPDGSWKETNKKSSSWGGGSSDRQWSD